MSWAAAFQLATAGLGLFGANKQANAMNQQLSLQNYWREYETRLALARMADADKAVDEENAYIREMESYNRFLTEQQRDFQMGELDDYKARLLQEYQMQVDRQVEQDREAARQQVFQLEQYLENKQLAASERQWAQKQLADAQAMAKGERDEQLARLYEDRLTAQAERDWMIRQSQGLKRTAQAEREYDLAYRDKMTGIVDQTREQLARMLEKMGAAPEIHKLSQADIDAETKSRLSSYRSDVDRAAEMVASANEADLIRGGIDRSSTATGKRGEVAARLSQEYQNARDRAYDDALGYVSGRTDALNKNVADAMSQRGLTLAELAGVSSQGLEALMRMPGLSSATEGYRLAPSVNSGILDRNISSGIVGPGGYGIGSSIYDSMLPGSRLSDYNIGGSAATTHGFSIGSGAFGPYSILLDSPNSYMSSFSSAVGRNAIDPMAGYNVMKDAWGSFGTAASEAISEIDWGDIFNRGGSSTGSTEIRPMPRPNNLFYG